MGIIGEDAHSKYGKTLWSGANLQEVSHSALDRNIWQKVMKQAGVGHLP